MHFQIEENEQVTPSFNGVLKRVNVILGTNGSGKSKLLDGFQEFAESKNDFQYEVLRVTASRRIVTPDTIRGNIVLRNTFDDTGAEIKSTFKLKDNSDPSLYNEFYPQAQNNLTQALSHFSDSLASEKVEYRQRHLNWMATSGEGKPPVAPKDRSVGDHFRKFLSLFTEVFPEISIEAKDFIYNEYVKIKGKNLSTSQDINISALKDAEVSGSYNFKLSCIKNNREYPLELLSDGEKQILTFLADRYFLKDKKCLFLIDEPELNLDPVLAIKYWSLIEREMPNSIFVYATHSLDFSLRENVEGVWILGGGSAKSIPLDTLGRLPEEEEQRRFLSGIRGIVTTDKGIVVEGKESSFDIKFYPWVLGDKENEFQISGYGSCNDVSAATRKLDIWQQIVPSAKILGIIDADYKSDEEITRMEDSDCISLGLHDAESYLCFPELLIELATKMGRANFPSYDELLDEAVEFLEKTMLEICHHRMARRCKVNVDISLRSEDLAKIEDLNELKEKLSKVVTTKAGSDFGLTPDLIKKVLNEEFRRCKTAASKKDLTEILYLVRGKGLLGRFAKHFGLKDGVEIMNYVSTNLSSESFQHTSKLQKQIQSKFLDAVEMQDESTSSTKRAAI